MIDYKLIGYRIKEARKENALTQEALAEKINITIVYLSKIENGKVHPTLETLNELAVALNCSLSKLFEATSTESTNYRNDEICTLFQKCRPDVKPIAIKLMTELSKL